MIAVASKRQSRLRRQFVRWRFVIYCDRYSNHNLSPFFVPAMTSSVPEHSFLDPPKKGDDSGGQLGTLGHYRVIKQLGKGGMGFVFLAEDIKLERRVALKVMNQKVAATPGSRKRFLSEARAMAAVHHDNVATIFEVGEHKGTPFMAMELLEGSTLEGIVKPGEPLEYQELIGYAKEMARGLAAAHAQGIVHRDIKPANIWLDTKNNRLKLLDFGLALAKTPGDQLSGRGAVVGTPGYLSPEQARSEPLDDRSDLYSTGVVLYELATGSLPLKAKTVAEQMISILVQDPIPVRERNDKIPQPLADLIHRLMAKEPRDRFDSASALAHALDEVEVECESKSEMAQAINQLQAGLKEVVEKKSGADSIGAIMPQEPQPNPFDSLPDALPAADPTLSGQHAVAFQGQAAGNVPASPVVSADFRSTGFRSTGHTSSDRSPASQATAGASSRTTLWIVVGIAAALLLILIPGVVYWSTTSAIANRQNEPASPAAVPPRQSGDSREKTSATTSAAKRNGNAPRGANQKQSVAANNRNRGDSKQSNQPKRNSQNTAGAAKQKPSPQEPPSQQGSQQGSLSAPAKVVTAKQVNGLGGQEVTWLINNTKQNGGFEQNQPAVNAERIPGWSIRKRGGPGGWQTRKQVRNENADRVFAFAGGGAEVVLTSDALEYKTSAGDVFRVGMTVGGNGPGKTEYTLVLGFRGDSGFPVRYQLAKFANDQAWGGRGQQRLVYEYKVDGSVAGREPFIELGISNRNAPERRGMVDRLAATVQSSQTRIAQASAKSPASQKNASQKNASQDPATNEMVSSSGTGRNDKPPDGGSESVAENTREVVLSTSDELGADASVKRGSGSRDYLGEKPQLAVQTRNGQEILHTYLRFPLLKLIGPAGANRRPPGLRGNQKAEPKLPEVNSAKLMLTFAVPQRPEGGTLRLYGLDSPITDIWPENGIVWSNSLSEKGLDELPLLAQTTIGKGGATFVFDDAKIAAFVSGCKQRSVTFILTGAAGNRPIVFAAKEDEQRQPPKLVLEVVD
jgi:serine/threonine protein kinase